MRTYPILILISASAFALDNPIDRCVWGHIHTDRILKKKMIDPYFPKDQSVRDTCKLAFEGDSSNNAYGWVHFSLSVIKTPPDQLKAIEYLTREGQCQIGSILAQKRVKSSEENNSILLIAKSICKKLPRKLH